VVTVGVGVFAVGIVVGVEEEDDDDTGGGGGGGGGGGTVEFNDASILFVDATVRTGDVVDILSLDIVGDDGTTVPLTMETDVLSGIVVVEIASEFDDGEGICSIIVGGGGSSS
jgi:hypothetical protein